MGFDAHSPVRPSCPQVLMSSLCPYRRDLENTASTWESVRHLMGLSLFTKTARASTAVRIGAGLFPYLFSQPSTSVPFLSRDMGPSWAVPEMSAGGAVEEPLPSIWLLALGWNFWNASAHTVIRAL